MAGNAFPYDLVLVEWVDSAAHAGGWEPTEGLEAAAITAYSVGWLVKTTRRLVVVVPHIVGEHDPSDTPEQACGSMTIPRAAIGKTTVLRHAKRRRP